MDKKDKKTAAIVAGVFIIIAIILWLLMRAKNKTIYLKGQPASGGMIGNQGSTGDVIFGGVSLGDIVLDINRVPFTLPTFALPPDQFSMISGCCSDCSKQTATQSYLPANSGMTFVFNEGNKSGDVFNYYQTPQLNVVAPQPAQLTTWYGPSYSSR